MQASRAPIVIAAGSRPEGPMPWAKPNTSGGVICSGVLPVVPKKSCSWRL